MTRAFGNDPTRWGDWIANVERPAEQLRGRYQLRLDQARALATCDDVPPPPTDTTTTRLRRVVALKPGRTTLELALPAALAGGWYQLTISFPGSTSAQAPLPRPLLVPAGSAAAEASWVTR